MVFNWANVGTPFSWTFVAAFFIGIAVARATRGELGANRWALVYTYLTVAVALAAGALFVPGPRQLLDMRVAYLAGAAAVLGFFVFRYKLIVGLPVLLIAALFVLLLGIGLSGFAPQLGGSSEVAEVHVYDATPQRLSLDVTPTEGPNAGIPVSGSLPGGPITPRLELVQFSAYYFFLRSPLLYRLEGIASGPKPSPSDNLAVAGRASRLTNLIRRLPGVTVSLLSDPGPDGRTLQDYRVVLFPDRTVKTFEVRP